MYRSRLCMYHIDISLDGSMVSNTHYQIYLKTWMWCHHLININLKWCADKYFLIDDDSQDDIMTIHYSWPIRDVLRLICILDGSNYLIQDVVAFLARRNLKELVQAPGGVVDQLLEASRVVALAAKSHDLEILWWGWGGVSGVEKLTSRKTQHTQGWLIP